jgi:geranylgeranylglycerol-phosphate geranylgeranyltransferase
VTREASPGSAPSAAPGAASLIAVASLVRWPNALLAAAAVALGADWAIVIGRCAVTARLATEGGVGWRVALAAASAIALTAVANASNDVDDRAIDAVAHPERPIPSGAVSVRVAERVGAGASVVAVALSAAASVGLGAISLAVIGAVRWYGRLKTRVGLAANVLVAAVGALPFLYGAWAVGRPLAALPLVALAMPMQFAREIAKDLDDLPGDRGHRRTLPAVAGGGLSRVLVVAATGVAIVALAPLVAAWGRGVARGWVAASLAPGVVAAVAGARCVVLGRRGGPAWLKWAMVLAIAGVVLALVAVSPRCG